MRTRDYEQKIRQHSRLLLHPGYALCSCPLAVALTAEAIRRAEGLERRSEST